MLLHVTTLKGLLNCTFTARFHKWTIERYLKNDSEALVFVVKKEDDEKEYLLKLEPATWGSLFSELHFLVRARNNRFLLPLVDFGTTIKVNNTLMRGIIIPKKKFCFQTNFIIQFYFFKSFEDLKSFYVKMVMSIESINAAGYVNGDIKPKNIVFDTIDDPAIIDFGLVRKFANSNYRRDKNNANGTPLYMSPDAHNGIISQRTDLISFGFILFEILERNRKFPWEETSDEEIVDWKNKFIANEGGRFYTNPHLIKYFNIVSSRGVSERPLFEDLLNIFNP